MWGHMEGYGWGCGGMGVGMLLFWGILIAAFALLVRNCFGTCSGHARKKTALDLLKERYARGEIGRDEFEQKKRDLEG